MTRAAVLWLLLCRAMPVEFIVIGRFSKAPYWGPTESSAKRASHSPILAIV